MLKTAIEEAGIGSAGLVLDPAAHTTLAFVQNAPDGDREFSFYRDPGADELLTAGILREVLSRFAARKGIEELEFTVDGEDGLNVVASFTRIFAENKVNIENMKALMPDMPEDQPDTRRRALQVFEISLPLSIDRTALRRTLEDKARDMGLRVSMQHRDIFEAVHRVKSI